MIEVGVTPGVAAHLLFATALAIGAVNGAPIALVAMTLISNEAPAPTAKAADRRELRELMDM